MDLVQIHQWGPSAAVNLEQAPAVAALIQHGDDAVESLLDCAQTDSRLTRSVESAFNLRHVISVREAALSALQSILHAEFRSGPEEIRTYWNKYKALPPIERYYAILQDDSAPARWPEAAATIVQPETERFSPGGLAPPLRANRAVRMRGEALRAKTNPTVSELMARRATEIPTADPNSYNLPAACQVGLALAAWDAQAAAPVAGVLSRRCFTVMKYSSQRLGPTLSALAIVRGRSGDPTAFDEYAEWLATTTPKQLDYSWWDCLEPLRLFPHSAVLQAAAEKIFDNTNSPWSVLPWTQWSGQNPIDSDLIRIPAFRRLLARELDNTTPCGSVRCQPPSTVMVEITNGWHFSEGSAGEFPDHSAPAAAIVTDLRWCDWIAWSLSKSKQTPFFNPFWPVEKRNQAIQADRLFLEQTLER